MDGRLVTLEEGYSVIEQPLYSITDKIPKTKARATLPSILRANPASNQLIAAGVFAKRHISYRTQFGPLDAPLVPFVAVKSSNFLLKSKSQLIRNGNSVQAGCNSLYYDTSKEDNCNWMCMVRPAQNFQEQNLSAHFVDDQVYFTTTRVVQANEELKVWYSPKYAHFVGSTLHLPSSIEIQNQPSGRCTNGNFMDSRSRYQNVSNYTDYFENDKEVDVRSVPPKKRAWRRASRQLDKEVRKMPLGQESLVINSNSNVSRVENCQTRTQQNVKTNLAVKKKMPPTRVKDCKKVFPCPKCGKEFSRNYTLKMHLTTHSDTFNFLCHTCGKEFKRKDKLQEHFKRTHLSSRPPRPPKKDRPKFVPRLQPSDYEKFLYKCLSCSLGFQRRGMLVNHILKRHPDVDIQSVPELKLPILKRDISYACLYCEKSYKSNSKRRSHIEKHHPGETIPPSLRKSSNNSPNGIETERYIAVNPVSCPFCRSEYSNRSKMVKHASVKHPDKLRELSKQGTFTNTEGSKRKEREPTDDDACATSDYDAAKKKANGSSLVNEQEPADLVEVDKILNMLTNASSNSFIDNQLSSTTNNPQQSVNHDSFRDNDQASITTLTEMMCVKDSTFQTAPVIAMDSSFGEVQTIRNREMDGLLAELQEVNPISSHVEATSVQQLDVSCGLTDERKQLGKETKQNGNIIHQVKFNQLPPRQLSSTYARGRKQLLLRQDVLNEQYNITSHRTMPRFESHTNNVQTAFQEVDMSFNDQNAATSTATTSLQACDISSWMY